MKPLENESRYPFCEDCGCRITIGRCKHGIQSHFNYGRSIAKALAITSEQHYFSGIGGQSDLAEFINKVLYHASEKSSRCSLCGMYYWQGETICPEDNCPIISVGKSTPDQK